MDQLTQNSLGFTLVDVMVSVAIAGALASVAIPQYSKLVAKSRQSEAKAALANTYAVEKTFFLDNGSYSECIYGIGFTTESNNRYYGTGSAGGLTAYNGCGPAGNQTCYSITYPTYTACPTSATGGCCWYGGTISANRNATLPIGPSTSYTGVTQNTFRFLAAGSINPSSAVLDVWWIDDQNTFSNVQSGL